MAEPTVAARRELHRMVDLLSEYECAHLRTAVSDIVCGERFWEGDSGLFYNEYVKLRYFRISSNTPHAPAVGHDSFIPMAITKAYPASERVALPPPGPLPAPLGVTLANRRSRREYTTTGLELDRLSTLLGYACGVSASVPGYGFENLPLRTFPTHGGLQSPEVYVGVRAVGGLAPGVYHYDPRGHGLELMNGGDLGERFGAIAFGEHHVHAAPVVVFVTGMYDRLRWKYGERAYRFLCTDIGFVGQNLCLVGEGLGLGVCPISGFAQDAAEELLGIDGRSEIAILMLTIGVPAEAPAATDR